MHTYSHCSSARSAERGWHCWASGRAWTPFLTSPTHTHTQRETRRRKLLRHKQTLLRGIGENYKQPHYNKSSAYASFQYGDNIRERTETMMSVREIEVEWWVRIREKSEIKNIKEKGRQILQGPACFFFLSWYLRSFHLLKWRFSALGSRHGYVLDNLTVIVNRWCLNFDY